MVRDVCATSSAVTYFNVFITIIIIISIITIQAHDGCGRRRLLKVRLKDVGTCTRTWGGKRKAQQGKSNQVKSSRGALVRMRGVDSE